MNQKKTPQKTPTKQNPISMQGTDLQSADFNPFSQANFTQAAMSNVNALAFAHLLCENGIL